MEKEEIGSISLSRHMEDILSVCNLMEMALNGRSLKTQTQREFYAQKYVFFNQ